MNAAHFVLFQGIDLDLDFFFCFPGRFCMHRLHLKQSNTSNIIHVHNFVNQSVYNIFNFQTKLLNSMEIQKIRYLLNCQNIR